ncbi:dihydrodipicolinate synthase family protein [Paracoccus sp. 1_MG-2023]|uniref:dihydrodipicolinate synthase family protein n=1 Tax=unclassified Paracoccus (in: a-proteobacteria) TaxID=2688777 RepID=UPI0026E3032B|nr:dihydrodipicolinate synthase family protein [Paracoccus sp. 1_MG-2023]MDO6668375.1 dihydrodipicolinate synthase family protein [Paracoccus sp. 1_MG-2023]
MRGLSGFPITPMDAEGDPILGAIAPLIRRMADAGLDSAGVLGSTGGYAYLTEDQRKTVLSEALDAAQGHIPVIAGVGALRADMAARLARHAADHGAAGLLLAPMSYAPLSDDEVCDLFRRVGDASDLPICIYNNPTTTHFTFSTDLLARLADLPNVAAVKMPLLRDDSEIAALRDALPAGFAIGYSADWGCTAALLAGADAWYSVAAGMWPGPTLALARAAQAGDRDRVAELERRFEPLWDLFRRFGSFRICHAAAGPMGLTPSRPPAPLRPLPDDAMGQLQQAIEAIDS